MGFRLRYVASIDGQLFGIGASSKTMAAQSSPHYGYILPSQFKMERSPLTTHPLGTVEKGYLRVARNLKSRRGLSLVGSLTWGERRFPIRVFAGIWRLVVGGVAERRRRLRGGGRAIGGDTYEEDGAEADFGTRVSVCRTRACAELIRRRCIRWRCCDQSR